MRRGAALFGLAALAASGAAAADLRALPAPEGAVETFYDERALDAYALPVGRFTETLRPVRELEGRLRERVLRVDGASATSLEAIRAVEAGLEAQGYERIFDCGGEDCGGFDFRFNTRVAPAPEMEVDLSDFRFLAMERGGAGEKDHVGALASRVGGKLFLQLISVETAAAPPGETAEGAERTADLADALLRRLERDGRSVLEGVDFHSGSAELTPGSDPALEALAEAMRAAPDLALAIVGHTDNVGDAALNQELSEARARAVTARLTEAFGAPAERLSAHGVGYLAPAASNATEEGRRTNRRVEAVVR